MQVFVETAGDSGIAGSVQNSHAWVQLLSAAGYAYRPRKYEVGQALTRMRGIKMMHLPIEDDGEEERIAREAEKRKRELAEIWNARRKK